VPAALVRDDIGEQRTPAGMAVAHPPARRGQRHQAVRPDIAFEVDREIVAAPAPVRRPLHKLRGWRGRRAAREPRRVQRLDAADLGDETSQRRVPAAHDEVDLGLGRLGANGPDRAQGHQEIADALEPQQQHAGRRPARLAPRERLDGPGRHRQRGVGQPHHPAL
jgi:hypothetical protein